MSELDPKVSELLTTLGTQALTAYDALTNQGQSRHEDLHPAGGDPAPNPFDRAVIKLFFDTDSASQLYAKAATGDADSNQSRYLILAKLQSDLASRLERDYKMLHITRIRALHLEAARRFRHAHKGGPIVSGLTAQLQRLLRIDDIGSAIGGGS